MPAASPGSGTPQLDALEQSGFALRRGAIDEGGQQRLLEVLGARLSTAIVHRSGTPFACRGLLDKVPHLVRALNETRVDALASAMLGGPAFPVDAIYLDKSTRTNWVVPGHQDRVLAVANEHGGGIRIRDGIGYAELDPETLTGLLALRVHFDVTDATRGALAVVPGSHGRGRLGDEEIRAVARDAYVPCPAAPGDVLCMRPLLLHRSAPFQGPGQRRVLHVVYATRPPRPPFQWRARSL